MEDEENGEDFLWQAVRNWILMRKNCQRPLDVVAGEKNLAPYACICRSAARSRSEPVTRRLKHTHTHHWQTRRH